MIVRVNYQGRQQMMEGIPGVVDFFEIRCLASERT
jgi:hypothetical protein